VVVEGIEVIAGEQLHAHAGDLAELERRGAVPDQGLVGAGEGVEGVAALVQEGQEVVVAADEVGEDEGEAAGLEVDLVAAGGLAGAGHEVEEAALGEVGELAPERGVEGVEDGDGAGDEGGFVGEGLQRGLAGQRGEQIPGAHGGDAEGGGAAGEELAGEGDDGGGDRVVEGEAVGGAVVEAGELAEAIVAIVGAVGGGGLGEAEIEDAGEDVVEGGLVGEEAGGHRGPGGLAVAADVVVLVGLDGLEGAQLAEELGPHAAAELLVLGAEALLAGLERDDGLAEQLDLIGEGAQEAGVALGGEGGGVGVGDDATGEAVTQRLAVGGDAVDEVEECGLEGRVIGVTGDGDLAAGLLLADQRLELAPVAEPLLEGPQVAAREGSLGELVVAGRERRQGGQVEARGDVATRRRRQGDEHGLQG
jgi:hypothetical protein